MAASIPPAQRPPRPPEPQWENFPDDLTARPQWALWKYEFVCAANSEGRWTKVPYMPDRRTKAKSNDPDTWSRFDFVQTSYLTSDGDFDGVFFALSAADPFVAFDFDHCVDPATGEITDSRVRNYVERLNSYTESSPSGTGLRVIVRAKLPDHDRKSGNFECYEDKRFVSITGQLYRNRPR